MQSFKGAILLVLTGGRGICKYADIKTLEENSSRIEPNFQNGVFSFPVTVRNKTTTAMEKG